MNLESVSVRPTSITLKFRTRVEGVRIVFAPTRSNLSQLHVTPPSEDPQIDTLVIHLKWPEPLEAGTEIHLEYEATGEPLRLISAHETRLRGEHSWSDEPRFQHEYDQIAAARHRLAAADPRQAFFFELDRRTNPVLTGFSGEFPTRPALVAHGALRADVSSILEKRLKQRWEKKAVEPISDPRLLEGLIFFSSLVRTCAAPLLSAASTAGFCRAIEAFAAGELRRKIQIQTGANNEEIEHFTVSEPDSAFVFLFAEMGIACTELRIDTDLWFPSLTALVKTQLYYLGRFEPYVLPFNLYGQPTRRLSSDARARIDQDAPDPPITLDAAREAVAKNLERIKKWQR